MISTTTATKKGTPDEGDETVALGLLALVLLGGRMYVELVDLTSLAVVGYLIVADKRLEIRRCLVALTPPSQSHAATPTVNPQR